MCLPFPPKLYVILASTYPFTPIKLCINTYLARNEGSKIMHAVALIYNQIKYKTNNLRPTELKTQFSVFYVEHEYKFLKSRNGFYD